MDERRGSEPGAGDTLRGAALILIAGTVLGIAYNALGLASRPRHGLAWINRTSKLESLEALQGAPGTAEPGSAARDSAGTPAAVVSGPSSSHPSPGPAPDPAAGHQRVASSPATAAAPDRAGIRPGAAGSPSSARTRPGAAASAGASTPASAPRETPSPARAEAPAQADPPAAQPAASALPAIPDVPGPLKLELATLKRLYDANAALVLDAREAAEYVEGHISGAISLPYNDALADPDRVSHLDPGGRPIVVYCSGGDCELSMDLAKVLIQSGRRRVLIYEGGFPEWQSAGYPVARGPNP